MPRRKLKRKPKTSAGRRFDVHEEEDEPQPKLSRYDLLQRAIGKKG